MTLSKRVRQIQSSVSRKRARARRVLVEAVEPRILMSAYTITKVADLTTATTGAQDRGGLIMDSGGNLYGTMSQGGAFNEGAVIEIAHGTNTITTIASFGPNTATTPGAPFGRLYRDSSGDLFGTTTTGGANSDGSVFEIVAGTSTISTYASFDSTDGDIPEGGLVKDSSGNLFGTTNQGGVDGDGTVFEIAAGTSTITLLGSFTGANGTGPTGNLVVDSGGDVFGVAGTAVFEVVHGTSAITDIGVFNSSTTGANPENGLVIDSQGNVYGENNTGGANGAGTLYEVAHGTTTIITLASFGANTGSSPIGGLVIDPQGDLFGTTQSGGTSSAGTLFELPAGSNAITAVASFSAPTGFTSESGLVLDPTGKLYGTTFNGGTNSDGTVFSAFPSTSTKVVVTSQPTTNVIAGTAQSITVKVENALGVVDATNQGIVTLALATGPSLATVGGTLSVSAVNGVATFPGLTFDTAGTYTLTAASVGLTSSTTTNITVVPAAASHLVVVQQPTSTVAGHTIGAVNVAVEDAFGNLVTSNTSPVTISTSDGAALGGTTAISAIAGVATFSNLSINRAGTHTLSVAGAGLTSGTSSAFNILADIATKLVFDEQPTTASSGQTIGAIAVEVEDAHGNLIVGDQSNVTLSAQSTVPSSGNVTSAGPALTGTTTVTAQNGVAVFNDVSIATAGTYTLSASDAALTPGASATLTVSGSSVPTGALIAGKKIAPMVIDTATAFPQATGVLHRLNVHVQSVSGGKAVLVESIQVKADRAAVSNLNIHKAGVYNVVFSDPAGQAITEQITIVAAAPTQLAFVTQPVFVNGQAAVSVDVLDQFGNLSSASDGSAVTLQLGPHPALGKNPTLGGTVAATITDGLATFTGVTVDQSGRARLFAKSGKLRQAASHMFTNA